MIESFSEMLKLFLDTPPANDPEGFMMIGGWPPPAPPTFNFLENLKGDLVGCYRTQLRAANGLPPRQAHF